MFRQLESCLGPCCPDMIGDWAMGDEFNADEMADQMPPSPNTWSDGSTIQNPVSKIGTAGAGEYWKDGGAAWNCRSWRPTTHSPAAQQPTTPQPDNSQPTTANQQQPANKTNNTSKTSKTSNINNINEVNTNQINNTNNTNNTNNPLQK